MLMMSASRSTIRFGSTLVFLEQVNGTLQPSADPAIMAVKKLAQDVIGVTFMQSKQEAEKIKPALQKLSGLRKVVSICSEKTAHLLPEIIAPIMKGLSEQLKVTHIVATSTTTGKNIIPRLAALLNVSPLSDVIQVDSADT